MESSQKFQPEFDPLPTTSVFVDGEAGVPDKYRHLAKTVFGETEEKMNELILELREALRENGFDIVDNNHLYRKLLRAGNLEIQGSINVLKSFLQMINGHPLYFEHVLPFEKSDPVWNLRAVTTPPMRDQYGRRLFIMRCFSVIYKILSVVALEPKSQIAGVTVVMDCNGFSYCHLKSLSFEDVRILSNLIQQGFPLWFRKIHICQAGIFFNMLYTIMKPFLSEDVKSNISFHVGLKNLHDEVPTQVLPAELGGEMGELNYDDCKAATELFEEYFKEVQQLSKVNY